MTEFKYEPVQPRDKEEVLRDLASSDPEVIASALYSACRWDEDAKWLEDECINRLKAPQLQVRWAAATCLGDLAFFRRPLDLDRVTRALEMATLDPSISDPATFSLSMVRQFVTKPSG
jgi:hypothetical protein